ncbi:hypothetical protein LSG31_00265 [Fodinisporobacter ferrooxydans]|uniref:Uncharacterized protein n=1 Tax=Fodinisporobacter ferrooxydans TaxID=2901836 RepID=A0ABY4CMK9_9BACL|nr:hypothetical protein LSG31_00265 [Alicyclobacillaceae bacterium MYW30-H2]
MKLADLIFVRGTSFLDRSIEDITSSSYSHVAGIVKENELIEAQGFRKTGYQALDFYSSHADVYRCENMSDFQRDKILQYVTNEVGSRYDYLLIGWEAIRYLLHTMIPYREPPQARICSTLWADAYKSAGIDLCPGIKYPTPRDLAESKLLKKIGNY